MRIIKLGSGCLLAVCVTAAMAASASAAPPEWGQCISSPDHAGAFTNERCTLLSGKHTGAWEWAPEPSAKPGFSGSGEEIVLETAGKRRFVCAAAVQEGTYTGPKTESTTLTFIGCTTKVNGVTTECQSNPAKAGEIETTELEGVLGFYITPKGAKGVALDLKPKTSGAPLASF